MSLEFDADLIVVGGKGAGGLAYQLMGSSCTQLSERSTVPVVVVPRAVTFGPSDSGIGQGHSKMTAPLAASQEITEMKVIESLRRPKVTIEPNQTIHTAAVLMEQTGVGALAVVDDQRLIGIVTDRDLVRRAIARHVPDDARIDSLMSSPVVTIEADADLHDVFALFRTNPVRRVAVVRSEEFIGMITVDDLLIGMAGALADLSRPVMAEVVFGGHHDAPVPAAL